MTEVEIRELLAADQDELFSVLGAAALSSANSPSELLQAGRSGELYSTAPAVLGPDIPFDHTGLKQAARQFLHRWGADIKRAICGNEQLYATEKKQAAKQVDVWVATLVSTLAANIHALAPFNLVLNVLAIMIVRSGLSAFCEEISSVAKTNP